MTRRIAWVAAMLSGLYLLIAGPLPDPLPLFDEGVALWIFLKAMGHLGYDMRGLTAGLGRRKPRSGRAAAKRPAGPTVDV